MLLFSSRSPSRPLLATLSESLKWPEAVRFATTVPTSPVISSFVFGPTEMALDAAFVVPDDGIAGENLDQGHRMAADGGLAGGRVARASQEIRAVDEQGGSDALFQRLDAGGKGGESFGQIHACEDLGYLPEHERCRLPPAAGRPVSPRHFTTSWASNLLEPSTLSAMHIEQSEFHDHLLRGLAHKMNNILGLFHGYLGLLMDDKTLDLATREGLNRIREGANSASELMDRTKAFTTPSSTVWRQIKPEDFFRTLLPALQTYATRGVQIRLRFDDNLPDLWVDVSRLRIADEGSGGERLRSQPAERRGRDFRQIAHRQGEGQKREDSQARRAGSSLA